MEKYLGHYVYAEWDENAERLILTAEDCVRVTNVIYMERVVLENLFRYLDELAQCNGWDK